MQLVYKMEIVSRVSAFQNYQNISDVILEGTKHTDNVLVMAS